MIIYIISAIALIILLNKKHDSMYPILENLETVFEISNLDKINSCSYAGKYEVLYEVLESKKFIQFNYELTS